MFQKIPHKERMRHIKYREEAWERDEERHERKLRQMIAEKEAAMRQEPSPVSDKERECMEDMKRLMKIMEEST